LKLYLILAVLLLASQPLPMMLTIDSSGVVEASIRMAVSEGLNEVKLPAEPIPETIEVMMGGKPLIPIYENGSLYFLSPAPGEVKITYLVNISARNHIFSFRILGENLTGLMIDPQVILLTAPEKIEGMEYVNGKLLIKFYGPEEIEYAVRAQIRENITATRTSTSTRRITTSASETVISTTRSTTVITSKETTSVQDRGGANYYDVIVVVVIIALAITLSAILLLRKKSSELDRGLSSVDRAILEKVKEAGGSILQGELQNELNIPKTTLWRHVKKLEKLGYVRIVKEGPFNRLVLVRHFR